MKFLRFAVPAAVIVFLGAGTSFAAEGALPGEPLYPVKVGVNEKVTAALTFSAEAKADLETRLAAKRLAEASELAARGDLDAEVAARIAANFQDFADRAEARIEVLRLNGKVEAAETVSAGFAAALQAHDRALTAIAVRKGGSAARSATATIMATSDAAAGISLEGDMMADIGDDAIVEITVPLRAVLKAMSDDRRSAEAELTAGTRVEAQAVAERRIAAAAQMIASARAELARRNAQLSAEVRARAEAELATAARFEAEARAKLSGGEYRDAVERANKAARLANEVSVLINLQAAIGGSGSAGAATQVAPAPTRDSSGRSGGSDDDDDDDRDDDRGGLNLFSDDSVEIRL